MEDEQSARRIFVMYRERWAAEDSFNVTKECLGWEEGYSHMKILLANDSFGGLEWHHPFHRSGCSARSMGYLKCIVPCGRPPICWSLWLGQSRRIALLLASANKVFMWLYRFRAPIEPLLVLLVGGAICWLTCNELGTRRYTFGKKEFMSELRK